MEYKSNRAVIDKALQAGIKKGLDAAAIHLQGKVKQALNGGSPSSPGSPPGKKTGDLGRSIQIDRSRNKGRYPRVRVGTNKVYARIHEFGGTITPKRAKALHFQLADGSWRTAQRVVIPARPFMRPTLKREAKTMRRIIRNTIDREFAKVRG